MILDKVNSPKDVKALSISEMNSLANEMRELIIKKVNTIGGHMGPNLGIVETTIAMHYVFNSPVDKFIFGSLILTSNLLHSSIICFVLFETPIILFKISVSK